jgi:hypothetical protein
MYITITLAGSWEWVGIKLNGQVESFPLQYVPTMLLLRLPPPLSPVRTYNEGGH